MLYVDSSALLKRYVREPESEWTDAVLLLNPDWVLGAHTRVEITRNLARLLPKGEVLGFANAAFERDWGRSHRVAIDDETCVLAAEIAVNTGARSLDALHLACARRALGHDAVFFTFDSRQADAARQLGFRLVAP